MKMKSTTTAHVPGLDRVFPHRLDTMDYLSVMLVDMGSSSFRVDTWELSQRLFEFDADRGGYVCKVNARDFLAIMREAIDRA